MIKEFEMRFAIDEEQKSVSRYIQSISKPTGENFWELLQMESVKVQPTTPTVVGEELPEFKIDQNFSGVFTTTDEDIIQKIMSSPNVQFVLHREQKRKHRKHRINKKWAKRYGYNEEILIGTLQPNYTKLLKMDEVNPRCEFTLENMKIIRRETK